MADTQTYKGIVEQTKKLVAEQRHDLLHALQGLDEDIIEVGFSLEEEQRLMDRANKLKQSGGLAAAREAIKLVQKYKDAEGQEGRRLSQDFVKNLTITY